MEHIDKQAEIQETRTKVELEAGLRALLREKPLEQIRVRELADWCGIRRQSFYYHFSDVYHLLDWSAQRERELLPQRQAGFLTWQQVLLDLLAYTAENRPYYQTILRVLGRKRLWEVLEPAFQNMQDNIIAHCRQKTPEGLPSVVGEALERRQKGGGKLAQIVMEAWVNDAVDTTPREVIQEIESIAEGMTTGVLLKSLLSEREE